MLQVWISLLEGIFRNYENDTVKRINEYGLIFLCLDNQPWQQITLLPESYQVIHEANIEYMRKNSGEEKGLHIFKDFEIQKMLRNLAYWRLNADVSTQNKKNFLRIF